MTPAEAAKSAEIVLSCVGDDPDLRAIALGDGGAIAAMKRGAIYVDHTTASAGVAREIDAAGRARGVACLDAPFSAPAWPPETGASRHATPRARPAASISRAIPADAVVWST